MITSVEAGNNSLYAFLSQTAPAYIDVVPKYWLEHEQPVPSVQLCLAALLLIICIPGNISQLLVIIAYFRYSLNICKQLLHIHVRHSIHLQIFVLYQYCFRSRELRTASNWLLISLLAADFMLLSLCYPSVYQNLRGAPVLGITGKAKSQYYSIIAVFFMLIY